MSKNILFRGQTRKKGEKVTMSGTPIPSNWVFGGIFPQNNGGDFAIIYQQDPEIQKFPVYAETVCQYTGKNDKYGGKIFENDIITYVANINASNVSCKGNVFYSETLAAYMVTVKADASHSPDRDNDSYLIPASIPLSECGNLVVIGNVFDGESRTIRTSALTWTSTEKLTLSSTPSTEFSIWMPCMMDISIHGTLLRVVKRNALRNF